MNFSESSTLIAICIEIVAVSLLNIAFKDLYTNEWINLVAFMVIAITVLVRQIARLHQKRGGGQ